MRQFPFDSRFLAIAYGLALLAGCDRGGVTHYRVAKVAAEPATTTASARADPPPGMAGDVAPPPAPSGGALRWTLPSGWTETAGGPMRFASLKPPVKGKIDASVVVLPGPAGGELANVNRWRGQIGLPALDEGALAGARKVVKTRAGPLAVYDFTNEAAPKSRVVAGLTEVGGSTWFVKLAGEADAVAAARPDFMKLLGSLHVDESR